MKQIAVSIMVVGLCFYHGYLNKNKVDTSDNITPLVAIIGAIWLLFS